MQLHFLRIEFSTGVLKYNLTVVVDSKIRISVDVQTTVIALLRRVLQMPI